MKLVSSSKYFRIENPSTGLRNCYFLKAGGSKKFYPIDRPRQEKILPGVCSEEEVINILRFTENLKQSPLDQLDIDD